jgi:phosphoribosylamine--glycine ligase
MRDKIMETIIYPTLEGMRKDGRPYQGFLYAGVMIGHDNVPKVLEFNCRFGDPETQPIMMRLKSDLAEACLSVLTGDAETVDLEWDARSSLGVVLAAGGYPLSFESGDVISGLEIDIADTKVFHAGTREVNGECVTAGGRVLCVVGLGKLVGDAHAKAYSRAKTIKWRGRYFRNDIGYRAIAREIKS